MERSLDIKKWIRENPKEETYKHRLLDKNPTKVLYEVGIRVGHFVLDFGCGPGTYTISAAKLVGKRGRVYALDVNSGFLDLMEKNAKQEEIKNIIRIDFSGKGKIPLENEGIDIILLIDVLHIIQDRKTLFDEAYRILKRTGFIAVYPMHIEERAVEELAINANLKFDSKKFQNHFLIFRKTTDKTDFVQF